MKFLLFGTGDYYERYKGWFRADDIVALLDNAVVKHGTKMDGHDVVAPEMGVALRYDYIVILSFYVEEMRKQLLELGVEQERILHFFDLHKIRRFLSPRKATQYFATSLSEKGKTVLLLLHDLTLGGPSLALMRGAEVLERAGYRVTIGSMLDGPLREIILQKGIPVVVDKNLQIDTMAEVEWVQEYDLIICNTISYFVFLSQRNSEIPIIWWLHDSDFFYGGVSREVLEKIEKENLKIVSVGSVPKKAMQKYRPDFEIGELIYGVSVGK